MITDEVQSLNVLIHHINLLEQQFINIRFKYEHEGNREQFAHTCGVLKGLSLAVETIKAHRKIEDGGYHIQEIGTPLGYKA